VALATGVLVMGLIPAAQAATTLAVDDDGLGTPANCNAATPTSATINAAVTLAAPGDTIVVCPGLYPESVAVAKANLKILGAQHGVDARGRVLPDSAESIVDPPGSTTAFDLSANRIRLDGFKIEGATDNAGLTTRASASGYILENNIVQENVFGLYLQSGGATQTIVRFNAFLDNNEPGSASGNGIYSDAGAKTVLIRVNSFAENTNAAILFADGGVDNSNVVIQNNVSRNDASLVSLFRATNFQVISNKSFDTRNADDVNQGSAIRVGAESDGVLIQGNKLTNPAFSGIAVRDDFGFFPSNIDVISNVVRNAENDGIDVTATNPGVVNARQNNVRANDVDGIFYDSGTTDNVIRLNTSLNNGDFDCHDASTGPNTAGTANFWRQNTGVTDSPNVCKPPA
jgi:hypothetical protein